MSKTLTEIAQQLKDANKKVQLIYAFNGAGKTRLSREFKQLVAPKENGDGDANVSPRNKFLYYNAFTEDLFYWDNDLEGDTNPKLKIQPNSYTDWLLTLLKDLGQDGNIIKYFQHFTNDKLTPHFSEDFTEITFSLERGNDEITDNLKISKGEESNFIWSVFYTLLDQVITVLEVAEPTARETDKFNQLEYVFIDDPVSSLDENHLIELAVHLAELIKSDKSEIKFILTTHNPLFFNVLLNELNNDDKNNGYKKKWFKNYLLNKEENGTFLLVEQPEDSAFSYHLYLKSELEKAIESGRLGKYHFNYLRNILEKTTIFLGYKRWGELLPQTADGNINPYEARIMNLRSHSKYAGEEVKDLTEDDKRVLTRLVKHLNKIYKPDLTDEQ
ncbi:AAA family ATPase [Vibrio cholerae]|uniref:AAA family ATPase n=1 Tax=Vibrio cholerae TaxID=666 RepID=UPI000663F555|nr:AAA family ATPase [Vibrio cholerae]EGR2529610.1 anticodon nuclease [Vibrio cholerae]EKF9791669.1 AAA family ATPase [Vibrio cholerae]OEC26995.1 anticodon nuclease [Vibrio cholerae]OFI98053.1 anticodon nuclease [Vibrio cholerae]TYA79385.1 AAA family ATPase [Vibrio cholerae]